MIIFLLYLQLENPVMTVSTVAQFIAQQIVQHCQCQYSANFIVNGQLFCASENSVVYQAQFTSTDDKTALEIHNITQQWVLSRPTIMINNLSYQIDPNCSTVVNKLGVTSCNIIVSDAQHDDNQLAVISVSVILEGLMLLVCIGSIIISLYYLHRRKSKNHNLR